MANEDLVWRTLRCRTVSSGGFQQLNYVRGVPPLSVEERVGSPEDGPAATPLETLLAALGSCLSVHILATAAAGSIRVQSLALDVEADYASSPQWDAPDRNPRSVGVEAIRVSVEMAADAPPDSLRALIAHAALWSPVASTLHDPVQLDVTLRPAGAATGSAEPVAPET